MIKAELSKYEMLPFSGGRCDTRWIMMDCLHRAWNNFVMQSSPELYEQGSNKRAAAIAGLFMGLANQGGLNSFLTGSYDFDTDEVLASLMALGAVISARQLNIIVIGLGDPLPASSQSERWDFLDERWHEELDKFDVLSREADQELLAILEAHVAENEEFYKKLG